MRHPIHLTLLPAVAALLFPLAAIASTTPARVDDARFAYTVPHDPSHAAAVAASTREGEAVAAELQRRFDDLSEDCGSPIAAPVECSGVLLRATQWTAGQHSWMAPGRSAGVSFSWLRQDANFDSAFFANGFIVHPARMARALGFLPIESRCVYYINAVTSGEPFDRCRTRCDEWGITTAQQFVDLFGINNYGCSFRAIARPDMHDQPAEAWMQMVGVRRIFGYGDFNEVIVSPYDDIGDAMPVEAFFYDDKGSTSGLDDARKDQIDFRQTIGRWVPLIRWTPAASIGERAIFEYIEADQAIVR